MAPVAVWTDIASGRAKLGQRLRGAQARAQGQDHALPG
jgi:hypothetical protein